MLLFSLALLIGAFVLYTQVPALLIYWKYPWPVYLLLIASAAVALRSRRRGALRFVTFGLTGLLTVLFFLYTLSFSQLQRGSLAVEVGARFPNFTLETSTRERFSSAELAGKSAALYIFYRGDW